MTVRDVHLPVSDVPVDGAVDLARRAERLGYERVWQPETWGRDAVTTLAAIAERTDEVGLGSSVLNVYSRSAALLGQTAATLQEASDGRFRLGIGPSGPILVEGWHGADFERPLRRTRETLAVVRAVLSGEQVEYDGECLQLSGFRLRSEPPEPAPPVDVAGMGPKAVELAGRFADGWHGTVLTPDGVRERLEDLRRGAGLAGRTVDDAGAVPDVRVTLSVPACVSTDGEAARRLARQHVAFYVGGMGTFYRDALARQGYEDRANDVAAAWASGDRERATALVTDDLLDDVAAAGDADRAREALARFERIDGVDAVAVAFPRGAGVDRMADTLHSLAPR